MGWEIAQRITLPQTQRGVANTSQALAIEDQTLLVSNWGNDGGEVSDQQVYFYQKGKDGVFELKQTEDATSVNGAGGYGFGVALDVHGNICVVGEGRAGGANRPGRAHIYQKQKDGSWERLQTLSRGGNEEQFGLTASVYGNYVAVGAIGVDGGRGAVYVFMRNDSGEYIEVQKIPGDTATSDFGGNVTKLYENYLVAMDGAGAAGILHFYMRDDNGTYNKVERVVFADTADATGNGAGIGVYGNSIVASAVDQNDPDGTADTGIVAFYQRGNDGNLKRLSQFFGTSATSKIGRKVAIFGNFAVAVDGSGSPRAITFYKRGNDGEWKIDTTTSIADANLGDFDGMDITGNYLAITSPNATGVNNRGQVLIFNRKY